MNGKEFYELTKKTRAAQKLYFQSRLQGDLVAAKQLERELDKAIETWLDGEKPADAQQANLFAEDGNER